jgi:hypothetical protein
MIFGTNLDECSGLLIECLSWLSYSVSLPKSLDLTLKSATTVASYATHFDNRSS